MFGQVVTQDPEALRTSIDRALITYNCYTWMLEAIPKPEESLAFANRASLRELLDRMRGDWSLYNDYTDKIVPFETQFMKSRHFYAGEGVDLSKVPYMVFKDNRLLAPEIISDAEAKKRFSNNPDPYGPLTTNVSSPALGNAMMLGAGALAVLVGALALRPKKRRTVGYKTTWYIGGKEYSTWEAANREHIRLRQLGKRDVPIQRTRRLSGLHGTEDEHRSRMNRILLPFSKAVGYGDKPNAKMLYTILSEHSHYVSSQSPEYREFKRIEIPFVDLITEDSGLFGLRRNRRR
jgi:hypothetical protein